MHTNYIEMNINISHVDNAKWRTHSNTRIRNMAQVSIDVTLLFISTYGMSTNAGLRSCLFVNVSSFPVHQTAGNSSVKCVFNIDVQTKC